MRFEVPQFIDVEDKIFGPLTFKQFIYLLGGGGLAYVSYKIIPTPFWIPVSLALVICALALAFYKLNNRPFIEIAQAWISFQWKGKKFIWQRAPSKPRMVEQPVVLPPEPKQMKDLTADRVSSLAQNLDILDQ